MYYSKQIYSPTRKIKKVISRAIGTWSRKVWDFVSENAPKIKSLVPETQSLLPATKVFVGNNWLVMLKTSFTVLTLLVFCFAMINAENFQAYDEVVLANGSGLAEASIQENDVVAIDLENAQVDDEGNVSTFTYKVKPRDTIGGIASQFGTTAKNLRQINNLKDNAILKPGQVLTISVLEGIVVPNKLGKVTVQQFAAHYGLDLEDLMAANNYDSILTVLEGDYEVFVPITESDAIQAGLIKPEPVPEKIIAKPNNGKKTNTAKTTTSIKNVNSIGRPYYSKTETASRQGFVAGQCTAYVAGKLPAIAKAIRAEGGGDARRWGAQARKAGLKVSKTATIGSVGVMGKGYGSRGHVGIVVSKGGGKICMKNANVHGRGIVSTDCFDEDAFTDFITQ